MVESKGERSSLSELNQVVSEWVKDGRGGQSWWKGGRDRPNRKS